MNHSLFYPFALIRRNSKTFRNSYFSCCIASHKGWANGQTWLCSYVDDAAHCHWEMRELNEKKIRRNKKKFIRANWRTSECTHASTFVHTSHWPWPSLIRFSVVTAAIVAAAVIHQKTIKRKINRERKKHTHRIAQCTIFLQIECSKYRMTCASVCTIMVMMTLALRHSNVEKKEAERRKGTRKKSIAHTHSEWTDF